MDLQHIPLRQLKVAAVNVRHSRQASDVSDILPSIRRRGVLQPLLVRPNGEGFEIIAGRRRYFAVKQIAEEESHAAEETIVPDGRGAGKSHGLDAAATWLFRSAPVPDSHVAMAGMPLRPCSAGNGGKSVG